MASPQELEWFDEYAQPRKMKKQIVNKQNEPRYTFRGLGVLQEALEAYNSSQAVAV
jgi:hypothetical protein